MVGIEVVESEDKRAVSELKASPTSSASQDLTRVMTVVERYIEETASAYSDVARLSDEQDSAKVRSIIEHRQHLAKYLNETKTFLAGLPELRLSEPDNELFWLLDVSSDVHKLTTKLLLGPLNDPIDLKRLAKVTVIGLINAWEQAVKTHATPFTASDPQQTTSNIAALFFVHKLLQEKLYKNLNSTIIQQQPVTIQF